MSTPTQTTEERFDKRFDDYFENYGNWEFKTFIKQELSRLLSEILEKKTRMKYDSDYYGEEVIAVPIEDLLAIAKEWGIEIKE